MAITLRYVLADIVFNIEKQSIVLSPDIEA